MPTHASTIRDGLQVAHALRGGRTAILLHILADDTSHFDWLIERSPVDSTSPRHPDEQSLICFRAAVRPDHLAPQADPQAAIVVERLPDHRHRYLDYEGPISSDRGSVQRVASGEIIDVVEESTSGAIRLHVRSGCPIALSPQPLWLRLSATRDVRCWNLQCLASHTAAPLPPRCRLRSDAGSRSRL